MRKTQEIFGIVVEVIASVLQRSDLQISRETEVASLGIGPDRFINVVSGIETVMVVNFPNDCQTEECFSTIGDLVDKVHNWQEW